MTSSVNEEFNSSNLSDIQILKYKNKNDLIQTTRNFVKRFTDQQRMKIAKVHVENALRYKQPRFDIINTETNFFYKTVYSVQTSNIWQMIISIVSFVYMYLIIWEVTDTQEIYYYGSPSIYFLFILDFIMQTYHQSYDEVSRKARFSKIFYLKIIILVLLGIDQIFVQLRIQMYDGRFFHPFRVFRVALPILYNREIQRSFESLGSASKLIFLYFIFNSVVVVIFALVGSEMIEIPPELQTQADPYKNNYNNLSYMIFIVNVMSSYDAYPDNELIAIQSNQYYYAFFIIFIFLNMFIVSSIPGSIIFDKFRETRCKLQLLDQTRMQNSLIVAFITLGEENYQMNITKMVKFLLYFYENRIRFIDVVTSICLKLNPNDHTSIHINQFMQLGRIIQENSNLRPPPLSDWPNWIALRQYLNVHLNLKSIVQSTPYKLIVALIIVSALGNALICLFYQYQVNIAMDNVFANIFFVELIIKIFAIGPENYFNQLFSGVDFSIVVLGFILQYVDSLTNQDALLRTFRIFRASFILQTLLNNRFWSIKILIFQKLQNLFLRMAVILPIIMKFTPLFMFSYYVLGVLGMQIFYEQSLLPASEQNSYDQYSSFASFLNTQLYFVQVLTEAGWSGVSFDLSSRIPAYFHLLMLLFSCFHLIIVLVLATLLKGIVWSTFITVSSQYQQKKQKQIAQIEILNQAKSKYLQLQMLDNIISRLDTLKLDSIIKREVFQQTMNREIFAKLVRIHKSKKLGRKSIKSQNQHGFFYRNFQINRAILQQEEDLKKNQLTTESYIFKIIQKFTRQRFNIQNVDALDQQDYEDKIVKISKKFKANFENSINIEGIDNQLLIGHMNSKLKSPCSLKNGENSENNLVAASLHIFDMHILLGMQSSWREQKALVIRSLFQRNAINADDCNQLLHKKVGMKTFRLDQDCTIRKTYLQGTKHGLIEKFEAEYFANIYGKAFKQINKVTIEPLIKLESKIVYALKNIFRYPHMSMQEFFRILSKIENIISNRLLKTGSLFKLVFQLNCDQHLWFSVKLGGNGKPHLSFLKNGVWIYNSSIAQHQIYYCKDLFRYQNNYTKGNLVERSNLVKKLYETFQSLALTIEEKQKFFESNPQYNIYDNYFILLNTEPIQRLIQKQLEISKIMVVLLTKQKQRNPQEQIPFQVSEIPIEKFQPQIQFKLDETESETFKKLTHLAAMNDQQATAREGLPFSNVLNFLQEINDILRLHSPNLIHHVENLLNKLFQQGKKQQVNQK